VGSNKGIAAHDREEAVFLFIHTSGRRFDSRGVLACPSMENMGRRVGEARDSYDVAEEIPPAGIAIRRHANRYQIGRRAVCSWTGLPLIV